ncbi:hypothetical protein VP01_106g2 [Puccinia sorghi]|uniref:Uncharacterized protein n=1 Tax=Puccinia sorghi TaxID=27349 RepID=A0A0L6VTP6_9BASI|nr:hypothetical protein VP01_106g2 [Puccinia sorghi]
MIWLSVPVAHSLCISRTNHTYIKNKGVVPESNMMFPSPRLSSFNKFTQLGLNRTQDDQNQKFITALFAPFIEKWGVFELKSSLCRLTPKDYKNWTYLNDIKCKHTKCQLSKRASLLVRLHFRPLLFFNNFSLYATNQVKNMHLVINNGKVISCKGMDNYCNKKSQYCSGFVEYWTGYTKVVRDSVDDGEYYRLIQWQEHLGRANLRPQKRYNISGELLDLSGVHSGTMRTVEHMEVLMVSWKSYEAFQNSLTVFSAQSNALSCHRFVKLTNYKELILHVLGASNTHALLGKLELIINGIIIIEDNTQSQHTSYDYISLIQILYFIIMLLLIYKHEYYYRIVTTWEIAGQNKTHSPLKESSQLQFSLWTPQLGQYQLHRTITAGNNQSILYNCFLILSGLIFFLNFIPYLYMQHSPSIASAFSLYLTCCLYKEAILPLFSFSSPDPNISSPYTLYQSVYKKLNLIFEITPLLPYLKTLAIHPHLLYLTHNLSLLRSCAQSLIKALFSHITSHTTSQILSLKTLDSTAMCTHCLSRYTGAPDLYLTRQCVHFAFVFGLLVMMKSITLRCIKQFIAELTPWGKFCFYKWNDFFGVVSNDIGINKEEW